MGKLKITYLNMAPNFINYRFSSTILDPADVSSTIFSRDKSFFNKFFKDKNKGVGNSFQ